ncbi:cache domain-containing protein [Shewanella sp. NIFS-20-20]|nr:cache domain-containing protein [Shewanella sp. NIFS-20-20]
MFGMSWMQLKAKVRYRILILTLLPILLTLVSLVFITIYWNISYTGQQLFMKVKADLAVAQNTLTSLQGKQADQLQSVVSSWDFQNHFQRIGEEQQIQLMDACLQKQQRELGLDFLRLVSVSDAQADPNLRLMLPKTHHQQAYSGLVVMSDQALGRLSDHLADQAIIPIKPTSRAKAPTATELTRGLVSRSLLPVADSEGNVFWYLDGGILLNRNTTIVDEIRDLVYDDGTLPERSIGAVTIFLGNVRIATNVPLNFYPREGQTRGRALGSLVSEDVDQKVLTAGQTWVDRAFVVDDWFVSAYAPLSDVRGHRVGMIYTGFSESPFVHNYLLNIIELGTILMLVLLVSGLLVYRGAYSLLQPIERIHHVVKGVQSGRNIRIGPLGLERDNELAHLAAQFDLMLDQLQARNREIQAAAEQLEMKVEQRTFSLQEKTLELERNVKLLNETRHQLVTNEKLTALGELTAGIAHEINNPTAVILGNMELIRYELGDQADGVEEEIDLIIQQVGRISTIIRSLLQYSRPGEFNAPLEMHQVTPIIEETMVLVRHSISQQEVILIKELQAHCLVEINRPQLLQVLINLVINATHAMQGKGRIWIRSYDWYAPGESAAAGDQALGVRIEVEDEGCGISETGLNRIFDPFYTTRKDGTGLGLSLSYGIIKRLGGIIEVSSTLGQGTKFTIGLYHHAREADDSNPYDGLHFQSN